MRNLTKTLAVVSILAPASAHPLGIGDIKLHSALNQNLNAEIALVLSGERASDIKVHLAPPDKFNEAGVPWSYFLSKIRFETVTRPNGSVVIKLTSSEALKEPFLDLLLEVSWPKGNLYRGFTVLVDPPTQYKQATVPVLTSPEQYRQPEESQFVQPNRTAARKTPKHYARRAEYGPTRRNDTLWKVAERVRSDNEVSVEQMMIALYEENPRAFYQENVNALLAGKTLKVPQKDAIVKLSRKEALAEFNRQTKAWNNRLAPSTVEPAPTEEAGVDNHLTLDAPTEAVIKDNSVVAPGNEKVDKPNQSASAKSGAVDPNDPIQIKIAALEKQLATMQQIVALKDQQLAALQNQSKPVVLEQPIPLETQPAQPAAPVTEEPAVAQPEAKVQDQPTEPAPAVQEPPAKPAPVVTEAIKPATPPQPQARPPAKAEESSGMYYPIVGGIGTAVLSVLGWLWWRKRKIEEETNTESMFASGTGFSADGSITDSMINNVNSSSTSTESSFLSEFAATDFDSFDIDQGEIDPISEADVYLAYGRYHQAEELIKHAVNDFPKRDDCKLKLLEIYQTTHNKKDFEGYATELALSGKKEDFNFWAKVIEMANEICPDSSLFSTEPVNFEQEMAMSSADSAVSLDKEGAINLDKEEQVAIDFGAPQASNKTDHTKDIVSAEDSVMDFDLTSFAAIEGLVADDEKNNASIDFDLSSPKADSLKTKPTTDSVNIDDNGLDFEFSPVAKETKNVLPNDDRLALDANSTKAKAKTHSLNLAADEGFEGFDFSFEGTAESEDDKSDDDFQFNFDLDQALLASSDDDLDDDLDELGVSDLTDMDECETKLDLARAYIDMGDADSAKDIIKEVVEKGSTEQQKIAQMLMADL